MELKPQLEAYAAAGRLPIPLEAALELVDRGCVRSEGVELIAPMTITPTPSIVPGHRHYVEGAYFDVDRVARVVKALKGLRHTKGRRWANRPLAPEPWQLFYFIAPVFGWMNAAGLRIIRSAWVEVARKQGKSTLASGLVAVLLCGDGELGAEVYAAATGKDQARQVFTPAKDMMTRSPALRGKVVPLADVVRVPATGGIFRVLSKVAEAAHGLNVSGAVVDEVHVHKSRDLIDAIDTGEGARDQPLIIYITTSDDGTQGTIYDEKHTEVEALAADRGTPEHALYGVIWAVPEGLDPFVLENVKLANPNVGVSVSEEYLDGKIRKAMRTPSFMPTFERLHLNRRRRSVTRAIDMDRWDAGAVPALSLDQLRRRLRGRRCFGGLDLSSTQDFTAWVLVFPDTFQRNGQDVEGVWVVPRLWIPAAAVEGRNVYRSAIEAWAAQGWVTITDGDVIDFDRIQEGVSDDAETFNVVEFAYDPWQAEALRQRLMDGGLTGWKCGQTIERLAPATHELDRLLGLELVHHGGNPALAWMASNVVAKMDASGRWKPEKQLSAEKIDGISAMCMAIAASTRPDREAAAAPPAGARAAGDSDVSRHLFRPEGRLDI